MFTDHFFQKRVQPPPQDPLYTYGWTHIQTDGDYIKRVVHGPPGDHTLKKEIKKSTINNETPMEFHPQNQTAVAFKQRQLADSDK